MITELQKALQGMSSEFIEGYGNEQKSGDEVLEALMMNLQFHCHSAEIHSTGNVHISYTFTTSSVYVIYCDIACLLLATGMFMSLF